MAPIHCRGYIGKIVMKSVVTKKQLHLGLSDVNGHPVVLKYAFKKSNFCSVVMYTAKSLIYVFVSIQIYTLYLLFILQKLLYSLLLKSHRLKKEKNREV